MDEEQTATHWTRVQVDGWNIVGDTGRRHTIKRETWQARQRVVLRAQCKHCECVVERTAEALSRQCCRCQIGQRNRDEIEPSPWHIGDLLEVFDEERCARPQLDARLEEDIAARVVLSMHVPLGPMTTTDIGRVFGVSRELIRQIEFKALRNLRKSHPGSAEWMLSRRPTHWEEAEQCA